MAQAVDDVKANIINPAQWGQAAIRSDLSPYERVRIKRLQ